MFRWSYWYILRGPTALFQWLLREWLARAEAIVDGAIEPHAKLHHGEDRLARERIHKCNLNSFVQSVHVLIFIW
jgi:hypothetical protein